MRRSTLLLAATIGFGLLYLAASATLGSAPDSGDSGETVVAWFRDHDDRVRAYAWFLTLSLPFFATFAGLIRAQLPALHRDIFFFGAITLAAETAVQGWLWAGMAWHPDDLQPGTARTLLDVASFWGPVLTSTTVTMLAPVAVVALRREAGLPRWLGALAAIAVAEQLIETVTVFGRHGFIAPGGPMNIYLGAGLVAVTLLALGICAARTADVNHS
jgi:apolipoprotein N-acyltransferase